MGGDHSPPAPKPQPTPPVYNSSPTFKHFVPFGRLAMRFFVAIMAPRLRVTGRHRIPRRGAVIIAPNHLSNADPPLLFHSMPRAMWYMAKRELFEMPVVAPVIRFLQTFPVEQEGIDRAAIQYAEQLLRHGQGLVIFPEGKCSINGELGPVLPGATLLALRTGVPIIPVGIYGTERIVPYAEMVPRPTLAPVRVHFGAPLNFINLSHLPRREQREAATEQLERALREVVAVVQPRVK